MYVERERESGESEEQIWEERAHESVSYTHLDVYKRQVVLGLLHNLLSATIFNNLLPLSVVSLRRCLFYNEMELKYYLRRI